MTIEKHFAKSSIRTVNPDGLTSLLSASSEPTGLLECIFILRPDYSNLQVVKLSTLYAPEKVSAMSLEFYSIYFPPFNGQRCKENQSVNA